MNQNNIMSNLNNNSTTINKKNTGKISYHNNPNNTSSKYTSLLSTNNLSNSLNKKLNYYSESKK